jgi:integrative and conjugative element protein (TIGR02256 family)
MRRRLKRTVVVAADLADPLRADSELHAPRETGGILMGVVHSSIIEITHLIEAGPNAERALHRFAPDGPWQREQVAAAYEGSSRTLEYLGDWHSHPLGGRPSDLDRSTAARIAAAPAARCPRPLFLIVTHERGSWELKAYEYRNRRFRHVVVAEG